MSIIVAKFGGTSLADAEQFKKVRKIVMDDPRRRYIVASAPGKRFAQDEKVTDLLLNCYRLAAQGGDFEEELHRIGERFDQIARELGVDCPIGDEIDALRAHLKENPNRDYVASRGEYLNSRILAAYLGFTFVDPAWCISFNPDGSFNEKYTMRTLRAALYPLEKAVIAGFYGADENETIHTFSRGGSDVTGSLVAMALDAELYENWTDVSGLLAADPRIVENPRPVRYLTCRELRTLSYMGATVIHADAVLPASNHGIPINIRNTNRPEDSGTLIVRKLPKGANRQPITGVAGRVGMSVIQIEKVMVSDGAGFSAVVLDVLKRRNVPFEQCLTGIDTVTLVMRSKVLSACKEELLEEIQDTLQPDYLGVKENLSMIAVVGERSTESSDANMRVLEMLYREGIEISTINQGAGKLNLLIGVPEDCYERAIGTIYRAME